MSVTQLQPAPMSKPPSASSVPGRGWARSCGLGRENLELPKRRAFDGLCRVDAGRGWNLPTFEIRGAGRSRYPGTRLTAGGFRRGCLVRRKSVSGFQTGDLVSAEGTAGKQQGRYVGRVAGRAGGWANLHTSPGVVQGSFDPHSRLLERREGCADSLPARHSGKESENRGERGRRLLSLPGLKAGVSRANSR